MEVVAVQIITPVLVMFMLALIAERLMFAVISVARTVWSLLT